MEKSTKQIIPKPWGHEIWWANQAGYVGKILFIKKGHRYSLQYHEKKVETQYLLKGKVRFYLGKDEEHLKVHLLEPGDKLDVLAGMVHRAEALEDSEIVEVSTNDLDDVVKLHDDYGRKGKGNDFDLDLALSSENI